MPTTLRRELTLLSATALVVSNMIGTGIFTTTGFLAGDLGQPALVLGIWVVGALMVLAGCLSYAELGINFPKSGGEYLYLREAWGPAWGFMNGWVSFLAGFAAPTALGALAFSEYLSHFFPALAVSHPASGAGPIPGWLHLGPGQGLALAILTLFTIVNILGLTFAARLQSAITILNLAVLALFLVLAFAVGQGHWSNFTLAAPRTSTHGLGAQFAASLVFVMFAYSGWNAASYVAEEIKDPERTLPRALLAGAGIVALFYVALNAAFIYALPLESLKGVVSVGASSANALFGARYGGLFVAVMAAAILGCVSAMTLVGPRVYFAMARDGCFFKEAGKVHPRWRTPTAAILYQGVASGLMVVTGTFEVLMTYIGFALVLSAAMAAAGLLRLRHRPTWKPVAAVSWCYPLVPVLFIGSSLWMLTYTLKLKPGPSLLGLLTIAGGGLLYHWLFRPRHEVAGDGSNGSGPSEGGAGSGNKGRV
jgi:APA family basic amino acid/polyamine antiporter